MKTLPLVLASSTAALLMLTMERPAYALGPIDLEIAAKVGYGSNDLGVGLGGRAGVSFFGLYGGVSVIDYLGKSQTESPGPSPFTRHSFLYGGEVGYGIKISLLTIRPLVGFGDAIFSSSIPGSSSSGSFYIEPGGLIQLAFGHLIVGVDAGCLIFTNGPSASATGASEVTEAFTIHGQVGVKF
jgi:hypothetical protein